MRTERSMDPHAVAVIAAFAAAVLAGAAWWTILTAYREERTAAVRASVQNQATQIGATLSLAVRRRTGLVDALEAYVSAEQLHDGDIAPDEFDIFAAGLFDRAPGIRALQIMPGGHARFVYPVEGNEAALGRYLFGDERPDVQRDLARMLATRSTTISGPYALRQGGIGIVARKPVYHDGALWGLVTAVVDVPPLLEEAGALEPPAGLASTVATEGGVFAGPPEDALEDPVSATVTLDEGRWILRMAPTGGWAQLVEPQLVLVRWGGLFAVVLVAIAVHLAVFRGVRLRAAVDRRTAELADSEQRMRALFELSPVALWDEDLSALAQAADALKARGVTDVCGYLLDHPDELEAAARDIRILDVNEAAVRLYGAASREELMRGLDSFLDDDSVRIFAEETAAAGERAGSYRSRSVLPTADGLRHVVVEWRVVPGHEDAFDRVVVAVIDETESVTAQAELEEYKADLERLVSERTAELRSTNEVLRDAQRAKDDFMAAMSHELRTPLNSILGFAGVLLQGGAGDLTDEQRRQLEMMQRSGRRLLGLVNDVLDLSRIETGRMDLVVTDVDLGQAMGLAAESIRPLAEEKGLALVVETPDMGVAAWADTERVTQILLNLLSNAVKFTEAGSVIAAVTLEDRAAVATVRDTGRGVPADEREAVFEPFVQLPSFVEAKSVGSGLGLSIARDLAVQMGGTLTLDEAPEGGAAFTLRLPRGRQRPHART